MQDDVNQGTHRGSGWVQLQQTAVRVISRPFCLYYAKTFQTQCKRGRPASKRAMPRSANEGRRTVVETYKNTHSRLKITKGEVEQRTVQTMNCMPLIAIENGMGRRDSAGHRIHPHKTLTSIVSSRQRPQAQDQVDHAHCPNN